MNQQYVTVANAVTVSRLGIFVLFIVYLAQDRFMPAVIAFAFAWGLDAVDGLLARRLGQATAFGSLLDKTVDRFILAIGLLAFISVGYLPPQALLLGTKDIGVLPSLTIHAARKEDMPGLGWGGKFMSTLQGAAILWLLAGWPYPDAVIGVVAALGGIAAFRYLRAIV